MAYYIEYSSSSGEEVQYLKIDSAQRGNQNQLLLYVHGMDSAVEYKEGLKVFMHKCSEGVLTETEDATEISSLYVDKKELRAKGNAFDISADIPYSSSKRVSNSASRGGSPAIMPGCSCVLQ